MRTIHAHRAFVEAEFWIIGREDHRAIAAGIVVQEAIDGDVARGESRDGPHEKRSGPLSQVTGHYLGVNEGE